MSRMAALLVTATWPLTSSDKEHRSELTIHTHGWSWLPNIDPSRKKNRGKKKERKEREKKRKLCKKNIALNYKHAFSWGSATL